MKNVFEMQADQNELTKALAVQNLWNKAVIPLLKRYKEGHLNFLHVQPLNDDTQIKIDLLYRISITDELKIMNDVWCYT